MSQPKVVQKLHPKQGIAISSPANEILYGGAAGGGKSHLMRIAAICWCMDIPGLQVYLFRRQSTDLEKNHLEGPTGLRSLLHPYVDAKMCEIVKGEIRFSNGSKIYLCHCKDERDKYDYQGSEMHVLLIDELTHFTEGIYRFLRSRVRLPDSIKIPEKYKGMFPRILTSSNPGNIGHQWVKDFFIDNVVPLQIVDTPKEDGGYKRQYIPARLDDNPSLDTAEYERNLSGVGSPALVKALRDGDWNAVQGAYFPEMGLEHQIDPFPIPTEWIKFRAFDWGSYHPFACYWLAVSDGTYGEENDYKPCPYPKGSLIVYKEWYGGSGPNKGLALANWEIAAGILERDGRDRIDYSVADPSIFKEEGGPSIAEQFAKRSVFFKRGDNTRITGAAEFRARLIGEGGAPLIYFFNTCVNAIRTIPALQHDEVKSELWDTDMDDHAFDAIRYGCFPEETLVATKTGQKRIVDLKVDEMIWTRKGLRPIRAVFRKGKFPTMIVRLSNGQELQGTPDHKIWVENKGFIPLQALRYGDMLRTCTQITIDASLGKYGEKKLARFHQSITFITSTATRLITISKIFNVSIKRSILDCMRWLNQKSQKLALFAQRATLPLLRNLDSALTFANHNIAETPSWMTRQGSASYAGIPFELISTMTVSTVPANAPQREDIEDRNLNLNANSATSPALQKTDEQSGVLIAVESVRTAPVRQVYSLTISGVHEFFANGILVANCMSRPWYNKSSKQDSMKTMQHLTMNEVWEKCRPNRIEERY